MGSSQSPVSVSAVITVSDVNDNPPAFQSKNYSASLLENAQKGVIVVQVIAEDKDIVKTMELSKLFFKLCNCCDVIFRTWLTEE